MSFGQKVQDLRKEKDWSQEDLAKKLGTSTAVVSKYERDLVNPSVEVARKLCKIFKVTLDYLINDEETPDYLKDREMLDRFIFIQTLPEQKKEHILDVLDAYLRDYRAQKEYRRV